MPCLLFLKSSVMIVQALLMGFMPDLEAFEPGFKRGLKRPDLSMGLASLGPWVTSLLVSWTLRGRWLVLTTMTAGFISCVDGL